MKRTALILLVLGLLQGCATSSEPGAWQAQSSRSAAKACEPLVGDQELVLNMARDMADAGRLHAALAHLERLPNSVPQARLNEARLYRVLGQAEAEPLYRSLLKTCLVAEGHHGLGQLEVSRQRYPQALEHLRTAANLSPANATMRNDLGVVYLNVRQLPQARFEFLTAMELSEGESRAADNLLTLLIYQNDWQQARSLVAAQGWGPEQFYNAEQRAQRLRSEDGVTNTPGEVVEEEVVILPPAPPVRRITQGMAGARQVSASAQPIVPIVGVDAVAQ